MVDLALLQSVSYIAGAIGVAVAAIFYVLNLRISQRNQELSQKTQELALKAQQQTLETRQAQLFMPIYANIYNEDFLKAFYKIMSLTYTNYEDYTAKYSYRVDPETWVAQVEINIYLEGIGVLVRRGLIEPSLVDDLMSSVVVSFWEKFGPYILEARVRRNMPMFGEQLEYLYGVIKPIVEKQHESRAEGLKVIP